jgi:hypothetical protein
MKITEQGVELQPARSFPVAFHSPSFRAGALTWSFGEEIIPLSHSPHFIT